MTPGGDRFCSVLVKRTLAKTNTTREKNVYGGTDDKRSIQPDTTTEIARYQGGLNHAVIHWPKPFDRIRLKVVLLFIKTKLIIRTYYE